MGAHEKQVVSSCGSAASFSPILFLLELPLRGVQTNPLCSPVMHVVGLAQDACAQSLKCSRNGHDTVHRHAEITLAMFREDGMCNASRTLPSLFMCRLAN